MTDFETHPVGTVEELKRLRTERNRLIRAMSSMLTIIEDMLDPVRRSGQISFPNDDD
jgi:hypothetical protein